MDKKNRTRTTDTDTKEEAPLTQVPTIKEAATYIVDKDGNEIKQQPQAESPQSKNPDSE